MKIKDFDIYSYHFSARLFTKLLVDAWKSTLNMSPISLKNYIVFVVYAIALP